MSNKAEPEVVAKVEQSKVFKGEAGPIIPIFPAASGLAIGVELITLQAHREAIAKKDAALKACVEALVAVDTLFGPVAKDSTQLTWLDNASAAITQAKEAQQ